MSVYPDFQEFGIYKVSEELPPDPLSERRRHYRVEHGLTYTEASDRAIVDLLREETVYLTIDILRAVERICAEALLTERRPRKVTRKTARKSPPRGKKGSRR